MLRYNNGISYLRTTRAATPKLYGEHEIFVIGGCKVLKQSNKDVACVIAAGITLFEALKAYDILTRASFISVIDLYIVKPLDLKTIRSVQQCSGQHLARSRYYDGGSSTHCQALSADHMTIHSLAVNLLPRSGKPQELLQFESIDAQAIISRIRNNVAA